MSKEQLIMPPLIEGLIRDTLNTKADVWSRQVYRARLVEYRRALDEAITKYDAEYDKAAGARKVAS